MVQSFGCLGARHCPGPRDHTNPKRKQGFRSFAFAIAPSLPSRPSVQVPISHRPTSLLARLVKCFVALDSLLNPQFQICLCLHARIYRIGFGRQIPGYYCSPPDPHGPLATEQPKFVFDFRPKVFCNKPARFAAPQSSVGFARKMGSFSHAFRRESNLRMRTQASAPATPHLIETPKTGSSYRQQPARGGPITARATLEKLASTSSSPPRPPHLRRPTAE